MEPGASLLSPEVWSGPSAIRTEYPAAFKQIVAVRVARGTDPDAQQAPHSPASLNATTPGLPQDGAVVSDLGEAATSGPPPEVPDDAVKHLVALVELLKSENVPGPQLFRLRTEFSQQLGEGTDSRVWGVDPDVHQRIPTDLARRWPTGKIAIKNHKPRKGDDGGGDDGGGGSSSTAASAELHNYIAAAAAEILTLSPSRLPGHPNIVRLFGWGLCLDTLETAMAHGKSHAVDHGRDTIDPCCLSLQLPLLVLERAEGDLVHFLKELYKKTSSGSPESRAEEGEGQPTPAESMYQPDFGIPARADRHELIRRLCIDIGHGLEFLHDNGLTHGDLKPLNVLVFRKGPARAPIYIAKLCDFGHADPPTTDPGGSDLKLVETGMYRGTDKWRPEWFCEGVADFETLRDYDLMVYGLVVWSAFCFKGARIPVNRAPDDPQRPVDEGNWVACYHRDVRIITRTSRWLPRLPWHSTPRDQRVALPGRLSKRIRNVIHDTVYQGSKREGDKRVLNKRPWRHLYRRRERLLQPFTRAFGHRPVTNTRSVMPNPEPTMGRMSQREDSTLLTLDLKRRTPPRIVSEIQANDEATVTQLLSDDKPTGLTRLKARLRLPKITTGSNMTVKIKAKHEPGGVFPSIDDSFTYVDERFKIPLWVVESVLYQRARWNHRDRAADLYHFARYRASRVVLTEWQEQTDAHNILGIVLKHVPGLDVSIIAWLCRGDVGRHEVRELGPEFAVWRAVLDPDLTNTYGVDKLDESERLDRFLLLLQHGACIEQMIEHPHHKQLGKQTILSWFLRGCRVPTLPVVAREIASRFTRTVFLDARLGLGRKRTVVASTLRYMTAGDASWDALSEKKQHSKDGGRGISALLDIQLDADVFKTASDLMRVEFAAMSHIAGREIEASPIRDNDSTTNENTPLLPLPRPSTLAPPGWITHHGASATSTAFEESLTKSITLRRPTFKPTDLSSVKLGNLAHKGTKPAVHDVNVMGFLGRAAMGWREGEELDRRIRQRFAPFDDEWFATEHEAETPRENVLAALQDLRPITSFTSRIPGFWRRALLLALRFALLALLAPVATALLLLGIVLELVARVLAAVSTLLSTVFRAVLSVALFIVGGVCVVGLVGAAIYLALPLVVGGIVLFAVAVLGGLPFANEQSQRHPERPLSLLQRLGSVVVLSSPVVAIAAAVYLFGWLCTNAPDGHFSAGLGECKRCLWLAMSYPFCHVDEGM